MLKALIVVDLQPEFIVNDKTRQAYHKVLQFVKTTKVYDRVIATQFIRGNSNYKKFLDFDFPANPAPLEFEYDKLIQKTGYGLHDVEYSNFSHEYHYDIVGCETDACVMKIALDMFDHEFSFNVLYSHVFTGSDIPDANLYKMLGRILGRAIKRDREGVLK